MLLNSSGADQDHTSAAAVLTSARPSASEEVPSTADSAAAHLLAELSSTEPLVSLASTVDHQPTDVGTSTAAGGGSSSAQEIKIPEQLISPEVVSLVATAVTAASDPVIDVAPTTGNVDPSGDPIGDDETTMMSTLSTIEEQPELGYQVRKRAYLLTLCFKKHSPTLRAVALKIWICIGFFFTYSLMTFFPV